MRRVVLRRSGADFVGATWTTPVARHICCPFCGWETRRPRVNGAWMVLKKALRVHIESMHTDKLELAKGGDS